MKSLIRVERITFPGVFMGRKRTKFRKFDHARKISGKPGQACGPTPRPKPDQKIAKKMTEHERDLVYNLFGPEERALVMRETDKKFAAMSDATLRLIGKKLLQNYGGKMPTPYQEIIRAIFRNLLETYKKNHPNAKHSDFQ